MIKRSCLDKVAKGIEIILKEYGLQPDIHTHPFDETDFSSYARTLGSLVRNEKQAGNTVAIDMTPGRKYMSAFSMYLGVGIDIEEKADFIFYHHLLDLSFGSNPYPLIPSNQRTLYNMKDEALGGISQ